MIIENESTGTIAFSAASAGGSGHQGKLAPGESADITISGTGPWDVTVTVDEIAINESKLVFVNSSTGHGDGSSGDG